MIFQFYDSFLRERRANSDELFLSIEEKTWDALNWMSVNPSSSSLSSSSLSSSSLSSSDFERCLRLHHRELVNGVEATHIMDYLFQEELLTLDDLQLIPSSPIQSNRMRCLLTAIHRRIHSSHPETVFHHFLTSLADDYSFMERKLRETLETECHSSSSTSGHTTIHCEVINGVERRGEGGREVVAVVETDPSPSEDVTVVDGEGDVTEEPEEVLHFPIMESAELNDANINGLCRLSPPIECLRLNEEDDDRLSPSNEQTLKRQTEIIMRLRDRAVEQFPRDSLSGFYASVTLGPLSMPPSNHGRKFKSPFHRKLFDFLSSSVNDQDFDSYDLAKVKYSSKAERDPDTMCLILYLDACRSVIQSDFATCKRTITHSLDMAGLTSAPNRFYVMYLSVRIWVDLKRRRLAKASTALRDALNVIGQDPVTCSGMTAGWIYVDEAKLLTASMTSSLRHAQSIRRRAIGAMERALEQFSLDESADGPYGRNFASVKLVSLLLACDDRLAWIDVLEPSDADLERADELLDVVDDSVTGICSILKPLFLVAQSDRKFRSGNLRRAVELAMDAEDLALRNGLNEEEELAQFRSSRYSQLSVRRMRGVIVPRTTMPSLEYSAELGHSSSEEADKEETDDERGSEGRGGDGEGGEGGGGCLKKRKKKRKKLTKSINSSSYSQTHLLKDKVKYLRHCLPLIILILISLLLLMTVAIVFCSSTNNGASPPSWGQTDLGPAGPIIGQLVPSLGDDH